MCRAASGSFEDHGNFKAKMKQSSLDPVFVRFEFDLNSFCAWATRNKRVSGRVRGLVDNPLVSLLGFNLQWSSGREWN